MVTTWAPDDFWQVAQPLIPVPARRPQGGGKRRADDRAVLAAIVYLVQAGCSWTKLPAVMFGVGRSTVHRRFTEWTAAGLWVRLHQQFLHRLGVGDRDRLVQGDRGLDQREGGKGGDETGPNPTDRGKPGSKIHILCDRTGLPLTVLISAANVPDAHLMVPLLDSLIPIRGRRGRPRNRPGSFTPTKPMTCARCGPRSAAAGSRYASPAKVWNLLSVWAGTAGSSSRACPGCNATAAWSAATNARLSISKPSPIWDASYWPTNDSPNTIWDEP
jgi:transposase